MTSDPKQIEEKMLAIALQAVAAESEKLSDVNPSLIKRIADLFNSTDLYARIWLVSSCSYLDGKRPIDLLDYDESSILNAAERSAMPIRHG